MDIKRLILISVFIVFSTLGHGQDSLNIRIGPNYTNNDIQVRYFFICDGVPIFKHKEILQLVDTTMIDSMIIHKTITYNCENKPLYNAYIEIQTMDSINLGLKNILYKTDNWILDNPLADLYLNNKKTNWIKGFKRLSAIRPYLIEKIDLIDSKRDGKKCSYGMIKIMIKE